MLLQIADLEHSLEMDRIALIDVVGAGKVVYTSGITSTSSWGNISNGSYNYTKKTYSFFTRRLIKTSHMRKQVQSRTQKRYKRILNSTVYA